MNYAVKKTISIFLLILTAVIWGVAFVAQSQGSDSVGAFTFLASRSFIASAALLPVIGVKSLFGTKKKSAQSSKLLWKGGILCGIALAVASVLQQIGIGETTVGKAGFITALYIVIVPIIGLFFKKKVSFPLWMGVFLAAVGAYLLCVTGGFTVSKGDWYVLACAFCFSIQIMLVDHFAPKVDGIKLACIEFFVCGLVSVVPALIFEHPTLSSLQSAAMPVLYTGLLSSAVGYTLQIIAQKNVPPALASLIMSLESVFAALAGWLLLNQTLSVREMIGCALMFVAIILAQINPKKEK